MSKNVLLILANLIGVSLLGACGIQVNKSSPPYKPSYISLSLTYEDQGGVTLLHNACIDIYGKKQNETINIINHNYDHDFDLKWSRTKDILRLKMYQDSIPIKTYSYNIDLFLTTYSETVTFSQDDVLYTIKLTGRRCIGGIYD